MTILLTQLRLGNTYLSQSSCFIMSDIFSASGANKASNTGSQLPNAVMVVLSLPPQNMNSTSPQAGCKSSAVRLSRLTSSTKAAGSELCKAWKCVWNFLESTDATAGKEAARSLASISLCFAPALIDAVLADRQRSTAVRKIIELVTKPLDALTFARAIPEILAMISVLVTSLVYQEDTNAPSAAEMLLSLSF